jgi:hypothetical protein
MEVNRFSVTSRRSASAPSSSVPYPIWRVHSPPQAQNLTAVPNASNHNVNVPVLGVVLFGRNLLRGVQG